MSECKQCSQPTLRLDGYCDPKCACIAALEAQLADAQGALGKLLLAYEQLLPGIAHIAVTDYELLNDAPFEARAVLDPHYCENFAERNGK